jgi:hypothetical protein
MVDFEHAVGTHYWPRASACMCEPPKAAEMKIFHLGQLDWDNSASREGKKHGAVGIICPDRLRRRVIRTDFIGTSFVAGTNLYFFMAEHPLSDNLRIFVKNRFQLIP